MGRVPQLERFCASCLVLLRTQRFVFWAGAFLAPFLARLVDVDIYLVYAVMGTYAYIIWI